jgi:DeoR/GlpR family transcriptional regulator of sugar metabolism
MVLRSGSARVSELADRFEVDASTIRRDLMALEAAGDIERVHGGAVAVEGAAAERTDTSSGCQEARVGRAVAEMVEDGETVFLGSGRLSLEVARCLRARSRLTIVTNGLEVAHWVATHTPHTLILTGGQVEGEDLGLVGQLARSALDNLRADHVVLDLGGVSAVGGLTEDSLSQAEISRMLLEIGSQVVVLVPVDRVGQVAAVYVAPVSDADVIVTGRESPSSFLWDLSEAGVRVVLA